MLGAICVYTTFAVVRAVVYAAEGRSGRHDSVFWAAVLLLGLIAVVSGRIAVYLWRKGQPDQPSSSASR
jgi:NADH:ubiquinone oxidoreductase subunit 6 (subunit J)